MERAFTSGRLGGLLTGRKSTKDLVALQNTKDYPTEASEYEILDDCGRGVSATVHRARVKGTGDIVAVKLMNLESMNCDLDEIIHEAQTMRSYNHPNVLPLLTSFVHGQELWMVMPFVAGGSVLHIMKYAYPEGLDEVVIATIGREVLKGLEYVHRAGGIHRDVKAGNILVDLDGAVKLGDFGVSANVERGGSWGHDKMARMTFVGTPCWMAPEVMEQTSGYDSSADIWSFGITLLEMCHGHAPFAKFPPMKVLLMTLQNPAPTLEDKGKRHFSKSIKDLVARCLQKEVDKRPTATQLLEHKFFKLAKDQEYIAKHLVANLPTLADRVQQIRTGKAATNVVDNDRNLEKSQEEYRKGVSSWNFDLAALKAQAASEPDDHAANALPTISELDEREDTLSGAAANAISQFINRQNTPPPVAAAAAGPGPSGEVDSGAERAQAQGQGASYTSSVPRSVSGKSYVSAFATITGQEPMLKSGSMVGVPGSEVSEAAAAATLLEGAGASGDGSSAAAAGAASSSGGGAPPTTTDKSVGSSAGVDVPISPTAGASGGGATSPAAGLSREGSMGALNQQSTGSTPSVTKQKKGRFEVSEHPAPSSSSTSQSVPVPLPMPQPSGVLPAGLLAAATAPAPVGSSGGGAAAVPGAGIIASSPPAAASTAFQMPPPVTVPVAPAPSPTTSSSNFAPIPSPSPTGPSPAMASFMSSASNISAGSGISISGGTVPDLGARPNFPGVAGMGMGSSSSGLLSAPSGEQRNSEDGGRAQQDKLVGAATLPSECEDSVNTMEPKRRGRFTVVAEQGTGTGEMRPLSKASSLANLSDAKDMMAKQMGGKLEGGGSLLGKPPPAPSASLPVPPVSVMLPKLQELLDHSVAHQAALQKLVTAVQDCERGRVPLLLSRTQSSKLLFSGDLGASLGGAIDAPTGLDELKCTLMDLKAKLSTLEDENLRLRERNKLLEAMHGASDAASASSFGSASGQQQQHVRFQLAESTAAVGPHAHALVISPRVSEANAASPTAMVATSPAAAPVLPPPQP